MEDLVGVGQRKPPGLGDRDLATHIVRTEMLEAGYTSVCEFHYLQHDRQGRPYDDPLALWLAQDGITPRIVASFDASNNRTSVTLDGGA